MAENSTRPMAGPVVDGTLVKLPIAPDSALIPSGCPSTRKPPIGFGSLFRHNIRLAGGPAPVRAYIQELLPDILDGPIEPGKVFDATTELAEVPAGYRDMDGRESLKVLIRP